MGGCDGTNYFGDVHMFDAETMTWTQPVFSGTSFTPRARQSAILTERERERERA
jgi:hypothetical protein